MNTLLRIIFNIQRFVAQSGTINVSTSFDILSSGKTQNKGIAARLKELEDPDTQHREEVSAMMDFIDYSLETT